MKVHPMIPIPMTKITIRTIRTTKPQDWMTQTQAKSQAQEQEWMTKPQTPGAGVDDANTGVDEIPGVEMKTQE